MNSKLFTKKTAFAFVVIIAALLVCCVCLNIFLIRPAVDSREYVTHIEVGEPDTDRFSDANKINDELLYYILTAEDGTTYVSITSYQGKSSNVVIPSELEGYPVMVIDETCFSYNEEIESVEIPDSVTTIGGWAFAGCHNLKEVHIPESVTEIGPFITLDSKKAVVYAPENSYAQQYCKENKIPFHAK